MGGVAVLVLRERRVSMDQMERMDLLVLMAVMVLRGHQDFLELKYASM